MILPATWTWVDRFVTLSALSSRLCLLKNHLLNSLSDVFKMWPAKYTDGASSGRLHSDDKVSSTEPPENWKLSENVCVSEKLALCFSSLPSPSHSDSALYLSFPASGHNRILLCFSGMCQNPVVLFRESVPSESAMGGVRVCACLRLAAPVCTFSGTECSFVWTAPLSDGDTWRPATHI